MQVPLRKTNINGRGAIPPVPDDQTRFSTRIGSNLNAMGSMNSYPQHSHLMTTTMTRTNGADGFTTTTKPGKASYLAYNYTKHHCQFHRIRYRSKLTFLYSFLIASTQDHEHSSENETRPAVGRGYLTNFFIPKHQLKREVTSTPLKGQVTHQQKLDSIISHRIQRLYSLLL